MIQAVRRLGVEPFAALMTAAWVIGLFSIATAPLQDLWRPLVVSVVAALLLALVARVARRADRWGVIAFGTVWLVVIGAWPLALAIALVVAWRIVVDRLRRAQRRTAVAEPADAQVVRVANALGAAAAIVALFSLANSGAVGFGTDAKPATPLSADSGPNVYVVLLDGYPSAAVLAESFDYDNGPFLAALESRGFDVANEPMSNYNRTLLTLTTMFHARHIDQIPGLDEARAGFSAQTRQLTAALNDAPVPALLRGGGYRTVSIESTYGEATITSMDEVLGGGPMTLFEEQLLRYAAAGRWLVDLNPDIVAEQHRQSVLGVIADLRQVEAPAESPLFAFAHVFSPHPPFVFDAGGRDRALADCYPTQCGMTTPEAERVGLTMDEYGDGLTGQITYLNRLLVDTVDEIIARDPSGVVILFSDHGARFESGPAAEHFRVFLAARTPGHEGLFDRQLSLVNVFPALLNAYFDAGVSTSDDRRMWAPDEAPLELTPVESP